MLYMPIDLFSPYIQGREGAIDRNWNDMNQSNTVEQGWLNNDAQQLKNWFAEDTFGDRISDSNARMRTNQNAATGSDLNTQIAMTGQPGAVSAARSLSDYQRAMEAAAFPNIQAIAGNQARFLLGQSADNAARGDALLQYSQQVRDQQLRNQRLMGQSNQGAIQAAIDQQPMQSEVAVQNLLAQQRALEAFQPGAGNLLPQPAAVPSGVPSNPLMPAPVQQVGQPMQQAGGGNIMPAPQAVDSVAIYSAANRLPVGQAMEVNGVVVYRDDTGLFILNEGNKQYIQRPQATPRPQSTFFSFGGS